MDYCANWFAFENYNLQQAFRSQSARVESDWQSHEAVVLGEFRSRKEKLLGVAESGSASSPASYHHDHRWQHPEKQKTLIHTAPVLTPTKQQAASSHHDLNDVSADAGKWARGKKDIEVTFATGIIVDLR